MRQRRLVGRLLRKPLRERIAPAGVAPHLGLVAQARDLRVERLDVDRERDLALDAAAVVQARLLDLDHRAAGVGKAVILLVQRPGEGEDLLAPVLVEAADRLAVEHLAAAASHLHRLRAQPLRHLPHRVVLQRAGADRPDDLRRLQRADELAENVARRAGALRKTAVARTRRARERSLRPRESLHPVERIAEPRAPADIPIEAHFAVGHDIEARAGLVADQRRNGVAVLFAIGRVAVERGQERASVQVLGEPVRPRQRAGNRGGQRLVFGGDVHCCCPAFRDETRMVNARSRQRIFRAGAHCGRKPIHTEVMAASGAGLFARGASLYGLRLFHAVPLGDPP